MGDQGNQENKENNSLRTVIISVIFIPIIIWLLYSAYQKNQESGAQTTACEKKCTETGYPGYAFQWPIFSGPKCTCLSSR